MKVYVMTEAKLFGEERYVGVAKSFKEAEKKLRNLAPYMREFKAPPMPCRESTRCYMTDKGGQMLFFIHEEELA